MNVLGLGLLVVGLVVAWIVTPSGAQAPAADWFADPSVKLAGQRWWDGHTWTAQVRDSGAAADRGRWFWGRFWGSWAIILLAGVAVLAGGSWWYLASGNVHALAWVASFGGMTLVCLAFYRFIDRQLALHDVIGWPSLVGVVLAASGAVLLVAANVNSLIISTFGISAATATVGFVEETTKLLVPVLLLVLVARYRDPRVDVAIGLAAGFGFAITETVQYAYETATETAPNFCGGPTIAFTPAVVVQAQVLRVFTVSPLHWLWTGIAAAILWRALHLHGRRGWWAGAGGFLLVAVVHSLNDSTATAFCGNPAALSAVSLGKYVLLPVMYLVLKAWARKSTPPQLIGRVSRGWTPRHLGATAS